MEDHELPNMQENFANQRENIILGQIDQIKNQLLAHKYLIKGLKIPDDLMQKITNFENRDLSIIRQNQIDKTKIEYKKRYESHDIVNKKFLKEII